MSHHNVHADEGYVGVTIEADDAESDEIRIVEVTLWGGQYS